MMEIVYDAIIKVMLIGILAWAISDTVKEIRSMDDRDEFEEFK